MVGKTTRRKAVGSVRSRRYEPVLQLALVVFGAALALGFEQLRDSRNERSRAEMAIESLRSELMTNRSEVQRAHEYHLSLADRFDQLHAGGAERPGWDDFPQGLLSPARVVSTAWQSALATGVASRIPYEDVLVLSRIYEAQSSYAKLSDALVASAYQDLMRLGPDGLLERYTNFTPLQRDFSGKESALLSDYDEALREIGR